MADLIEDPGDVLDALANLDDALIRLNASGLTFDARERINELVLAVKRSVLIDTEVLKE